MKKLLLLILVLCSSLSIKAQVDSGQQVSVFSSEDESYDKTYNTNFVDVYFANGLHFLLIYWIPQFGIVQATNPSCLHYPELGYNNA